MLVRNGKAVRRFSRQLFYVRLTTRAAGAVQETVLGVDPGSKKEGFSVCSAAHTYLNVQVDAVTHVRDAVETRRNMRRSRRFRKTPCRKNRCNRARGGLPPSTVARWQLKLNVARWLARLYPITVFVVEDVAAATRPGARRWNVSFSPLEVGKRWFYAELEKYGRVEIRQGFETHRLRTDLGLAKSANKLSSSFAAHCVDSWVLANSWVGGRTAPENRAVHCLARVRVHRRQLHALQPATGGSRRPYGGTRSLGFKRGALVVHPRHGLCYVGGTSRARISVHSLATGARLAQNIKPIDCKFLTFNSWKGGNSSPA